ncbi:MAG TPA: CHASE4 domain-containing protein [Steroidobacteraceae bacterium]|nr:CHASE4 domain-containing protein [Steroidobacteraceae bacterium]
MRIRPKVVLALAALIAVLVAAEMAIQELVILPSFAELERADAQTSMRRIGFALDRSIDGLELTAADWSDWGELFDYMQKRDQKFLDTYTTPAAMTPLKVNMLLLVDRSGEIVARFARELETGTSIDLDFAQRGTLPDLFSKRHSGLVRTNLGVMMIAAAPVLNGSGAGQSVGTVVMGRLLTPAQLRQIGVQAQASLAMVETRPGAPQPQIVETGSITQVYRTFRGLDGAPLMTLRVEVPREISARGKRVVLYASAYLVTAAIVTLVLLLVILNRVVLSPIARMTQHAVAVGEGSDLTARLNFTGSDELALLAREFDRMVERVAESRRQLVDQSFQAGIGELAKGVLHNLGNAMTPLSVRLSTLADRLHDAPLRDLEMAVTELSAEHGESARRADLQEFLRLGCRELALTIDRAKSDVALMQRQTNLVQTTLAEQMSPSRNPHVVESVRLPELIAQSLEIVPDACRQRLVVNEDESLQQVGVVRVARTVLRLILQNLIINASDAIRDAGRDKGTLRLAAEIVRKEDGEQLHLSCDDDGVGIAKDHLQRVFEKGYTTKSPATNHGIGLHWCANAIASLGGRIWAASEGPGRGASLHVELPLAVSEAGSPI